MPLAHALDSKGCEPLWWLPDGRGRSLRRHHITRCKLLGNTWSLLFRLNWQLSSRASTRVSPSQTCSCLPSLRR